MEFALGLDGRQPTSVPGRVSPEGWLADTRISYDTVAVTYSDVVRSAVAEQPYMRAALALFADVGCGPGHVTAYLHELGVGAFGIDLSPGMIDVARRDHPDLRFEVGSMTDLPLPDASSAGLLCWWA